MGCGGRKIGASRGWRPLSGVIVPPPLESRCDSCRLIHRSLSKPAGFWAGCLRLPAFPSTCLEPLACGIRAARHMRVLFCANARSVLTAPPASFPVSACTNYFTSSGYGWVTRGGTRSKIFCGGNMALERAANLAGRRNGGRKSLRLKTFVSAADCGVSIVAKASAIPPRGCTQTSGITTNLLWPAGTAFAAGFGSSIIPACPCSYNEWFLYND
jgi:hypothetical protein